MRFLVAEDDSIHRYLLRKAVLSFDHEAELTFVETGTDFIERFCEDSFDVAFLDYYLPDLDAGEVLDRLHTRSAGLPVIVLSSASERDPVIRSLRRGGRDFIPKDEAFDADSLKLRVDDVLRRLRSERLLMEAQKDECLSLLAGGIAHDLNNRLQTIIGCASLLHDAVDVGSAQRLSSTITSASARIADLASQLLAYAREGKYNPTRTDLNAVIADTLRLLAARVPHDVHLQVELDDALWSIQGDRTQLGQMLINLCLNAFEAMGQGGTLRLSTDNGYRAEPWSCAFRDDHSPGGYVRLRIEDSGGGMDAVTLEHAFEPFFSLKSEGRGLGLSAVAGIVHSHGGCIDATSAVGRGTVLEVSLPSADALQQVDAEPGVA